MECGICNAIKKWFTKKDDKDDKDDSKTDWDYLHDWFNALLIMNDKEKVQMIFNLMTKERYYKTISDSDMRELVRAIIVYKGTVDEFFKVNFDIDMDKVRKEKKRVE